jgi:hypothetical protein
MTNLSYLKSLHSLQLQLKIANVPPRSISHSRLVREVLRKFPWSGSGGILFRVKAHGWVGFGLREVDPSKCGPELGETHS